MDTLIPTHQPAPDFSLPDLDGQIHHLKDYLGQLVIINFWSAECPHVARTDSELAKLREAWGDQVVLLLIASNVNEPPELLRTVANARDLSLILHDADHQVADSYRALTTPHYFIIDSEGILRYQGAFDDITFRQRTATRFYIRQAVEAILTGKQPNPEQTRTYGCTIVRHQL
ncbi:MAG: redoxin domain-containing protein [Anaerolineales bacterium]|nr:MAG: redoxin domain-containing protein [Anaerolineales bacterium]